MRTDKGDYHSAGPCGCEGSAHIVKATTRGQVSIWKLAFRPPLVALRMSYTLGHEKWTILLPVLCLCSHNRA